MILLIQNIVILTIWCLGITIVTQPGMLLYFVREWAEQKKSIWYEPLVLCHWCLPSIHSVVSYGFAIGIGIIEHFSWSLIFMWPLVIMGSSILTGIIWSAYLLIDIKSRHFSNIEQLSFFDLKERKSNFRKNNIHQSSN